MGRSRGGLTTKISTQVDAKGRPVCLLISPGQVHNVTCAAAPLDGLEKRAVVIADKGYDADCVRTHIRAQGAIPNVPSRANRKTKFRWKKAIYRERNHVERFFNKLKQFRRIATRYDKLGATFSLSSRSQPCVMRGAQTVFVAEPAGSTGTVNIGAASVAAAVAPGFINAAHVLCEPVPTTSASITPQRTKVSRP